MNAQKREELKNLRIWLAHHLHHRHGMNYTQIGRFMGLSSGAVARNRCYSAMVLIKGSKSRFTAGEYESRRIKEDDEQNIAIWAGCKHDLGIVKSLAEALREI